MFSLKLTRYPRIAHLPGNPMYLRSVDGFRVELRGPALRLLDQVLVAFALSIAVGLVVWKLWVLPSAGSLTWSDLAAVGALAFAVITLWRFAHIATLNVNLLPIGVPLPSIDSEHTGLPRAAGDDWATHVARRFRRHQRTFDFAVRESNPQLSRRLRAYAPERPDMAREVVDGGRRQAALKTFLTEGDTAKFLHARRAAQAAAQDREIKGDLLPLVRLVIGRMLYPRPKLSTFSREVGKEEIVGERDSINLQMIARLYRAPLTLWFALVALILIASGLSLPPGESGHKRMILLWAAIAIAWAIYTLAYHNQRWKEWKVWLDSYGSKPMGRLPIFIHCPQNDQKHRWEELDAWDFSAHIPEYLIDSYRLFEIVVLAFTVTLLTLAQVANA